MSDDNISVDESMWEDVAPEIEPKGIPWKYTDKDKELIGTYLYKHDSFSIYNKNVYVIKDLNNEKRYIFGCTELDKLFEQVQENDVKIVFMGKKSSMYGNYLKGFKLFKRR